MLDEIMKARGARRIVYFHTDHFEPGLRESGRRPGEALRRRAEAMRLFGERMRALPHARRLTLFYKPHLAPRLAQPGDRALAGDRLGIAPRTELELRWTEEAWRGFDPDHRFEVQLHLHHEGITRTSGTPPLPWATDDAALDGRRFDLALDEALRRARQDSERPLERWFFVHGKWALAASDTSVCTVEDELLRLRRAGCLGDFTFPAGRDHVDPAFDRPSLVRPIAGARSYDRPKADPRAATGAGRDDRFFIWSSRVTAADASIDLFTGQVARNGADALQWAARLLERGYRRGNTIYVKTHAHALEARHLAPAAGAPAGQFPHEADGVRALIDHLADAAARAGGELAFLGASEVHAELMGSMPDREPVYATGVPAPALTAADRLAVSALRARAQAMGSEAAGLGAHGLTLLERGQILSAVEREAARIVAAHVPASLPLVHLVAGFGALAVALAASGREVFAIEPDASRRGAMRAVAAAAGQKGGALTAIDRPLAAALDAVPAGAAFVMVDAVATLDEATRGKLLDRLADAPIVLMDGTRAFGQCLADERTAFAAALAERRNDRGRLVRDLGENAQFVLFARPLPPARRGLLARLFGR